MKLRLCSGFLTKIRVPQAGLLQNRENLFVLHKNIINIFQQFQKKLKEKRTQKTMREMDNQNRAMLTAQRSPLLLHHAIPIAQY
jgi:hypothetical protein